MTGTDLLLKDVHILGITSKFISNALTDKSTNTKNAHTANYTCTKRRKREARLAPVVATWAPQQMATTAP
jgi:hypothetical protein